MLIGRVGVIDMATKKRIFEDKSYMKLLEKEAL